jgi:RNA recognition motif-containing protein
MTNIFVGNLSYQTTQDELHAAFAQYGNVERVNIITDRDTGQPRGFAFVEMSDAGAAQTAISQLNGAELNGRAMNVNEARPKPAAVAAAVVASVVVVVAPAAAVVVAAAAAVAAAVAVVLAGN